MKKLLSYLLSCRDERRVKAQKDRFFERITPTIKFEFGTQDWARAYFEFGVAYGEWSADGFDPMRKPKFIEELIYHEETTTD